MKQTSNDETDSPLQGYAAAIDASKHHEENWSSYSSEKQELAKDVKKLAMGAYRDNRVFLTARAKFISIKIEHPKPSVAWTQVKEYKALCSVIIENGIIPVHTKNNLVYRIYK